MRQTRRLPQSIMEYMVKEANAVWHDFYRKYFEMSIEAWYKA